DPPAHVRVPDRDRQQALLVGVYRLVPAVGAGAGARAPAQPVAGAGGVSARVQPELDLRLLVVPHGYVLHVLLAGVADPLAQRRAPLDAAGAGRDLGLGLLQPRDAVVLFRPVRD